MLAERFGGKYSLGFGVLSTAVFTLLTPWTVSVGGATGLIVLRVLEGLGEVSIQYYIWYIVVHIQSRTIAVSLTIYRRNSVGSHEHVTTIIRSENIRGYPNRFHRSFISF